MASSGEGALKIAFVEGEMKLIRKGSVVTAATEGFLELEIRRVKVIPEAQFPAVHVYSLIVR